MGARGAPARRAVNRPARLLNEHSSSRERFAEWDVDPDSITDIEAFREIPFTTKDDERHNQASVTADRALGAHQAVPTESLSRTISSSGTTGKPTYFGLTAGDRAGWNEVI